MVVKMRIFLIKIVAYLLVNNFIAGITLAQKYDNFDCKKWDRECPTMICESYSNEKLTLPTDLIPDDTCSLTISTSGNSPLVITSSDTFHKFKKLQSLETHLGGSFEMSEDLLNSIGTEHLTKVLFDIPELEDLSIEYKEFNRKNDSWMLPESIRKLHLSNGILEFDLRNCYRLTSLQLNNNGLRKIPSFYDPLPPLEKLDLKHNPMDEFMVNDIAGFCDLKHLALDADRISDCECTRLKQWIIKLKEWGNFTHEGSLNCNDTVDSSSNCTLEEALLKRENCLLDFSQTDIFSILITTYFGGIIMFIISIVCCVGCCCGICLLLIKLLTNSKFRAMRRMRLLLKAPKPVPSFANYPRQPQPQQNDEDEESDDDDDDDDDDDERSRSKPQPQQYIRWPYGSPY